MKKLSMSRIRFSEWITFLCYRMYEILFNVMFQYLLGSTKYLHNDLLSISNSSVLLYVYQHVFTLIQSICVPIKIIRAFKRNQQKKVFVTWFAPVLNSFTHFHLGIYLKNKIILMRQVVIRPFTENVEKVQLSLQDGG